MIFSCLSSLTGFPRSSIIILAIPIIKSRLPLFDVALHEVISRSASRNPPPLKRRVFADLA